MNIKETLEQHALWLKDSRTGERADFSGLDLRDTNFNSANLNQANFNGADLTGANFNGANLAHTNFSGADLTGASFNKANLVYADLLDANLTNANLNGANFDRANMYEANLSGASFSNCTGNGKELKSMQADIYNITYTHDEMAIGCQQHLITEWFDFTDEQIKQMDDYALLFWEKWETRIMDWLEAAPACH